MYSGSSLPRWPRKHHLSGRCQSKATVTFKSFNNGLQVCVRVAGHPPWAALLSPIKNPSECWFQCTVLHLDTKSTFTMFWQTFRKMPEWISATFPGFWSLVLRWCCFGVSLYIQFIERTKVGLFSHKFENLIFNCLLLLLINRWALSATKFSAFPGFLWFSVSAEKVSLLLDGSMN